MKLKVRQIGNSRGIILPQNILEQLGSEEVELTLIGETAVLSRVEQGDDTEVRAALAYASVKAKRSQLFERLAKMDDEDGK